MKEVELTCVQMALSTSMCHTLEGGWRTSTCINLQCELNRADTGPDLNLNSERMVFTPYILSVGSRQ
jgi:hypothetical protein